MLINTETAIGMICPRCGKIHADEVSIFYSFASGARRGYCSCGAPIYAVFTRRGETALFYDCIYCGHTHRLTADRAELFSETPRDLFCPPRRMPVGCLGPQAAVHERCRELKEEFVRFALTMSEEEEMTDTDFSSFFALYGYMEKIEAAVREGRRCLPVRKARAPEMAVVSILQDIRHILAAER